MSIRILTVQDISCVGQCSLTVALPLLSACGVETCVLPSAVLSTHTGGFEGFTFRDLTEDMPAVLAHWQKEGITFDAFYTGYLGNARQIEHVCAVMDGAGRPDALRIVDPAMADRGVLYAGFDAAYVDAMRVLCRRADVLLPNVTEACLLTDTPYREVCDTAFAEELLEKMAVFGAETVVLTGVSYEDDRLGVAVWHGGTVTHYAHRRLQGGLHGTGDVYASAFTGALLRGKTPSDAARIAADFTVCCIENTPADHWYGVCFEPLLPELIAAVQ